MVRYFSDFFLIGSATFFGLFVIYNKCKSNTAMCRACWNYELKEATAASQALADRLNEENSDPDDLDCDIMAHPEGANSGGYVPLYRKGSGTAWCQTYYDPGERWSPIDLDCLSIR